MKTSTLSKTIKKTTIILFWLLLWQIVAMLIDKPILFVSPLSCIIRFESLLTDINFYGAILTTLMETLLGLFVAYIMAIILAYISYKNNLIKELINPIIIVFKSVPVVSIAILLLIWQGNKFLSFFVSLTVIYPNAYFSSLSAFENSNHNILEAAKVYRFKTRDILLYIHRPNLTNALQTTAESSVAMAFKSTVAAEVIGLTAKSIGLQLYYAKLTLDTAGLFCYTITLVVLSRIIEKIGFKLFAVVGGYYD